MKSKAFFIGVALFLIIGVSYVMGSTEGYYVAATIGAFLLCAIYVEGCARL